MQFFLLGLAALLLVASIGAGCALRGQSGPPTPAPDPDAIEVVATTSVLADMVAQVGGPRVDVHALVPKGGEVHTFDPTPGDVERITHADLIVRNGLGLDDWLTALVDDAGTAAPVLALGEGLRTPDLGGDALTEAATRAVLAHL